jgi:hypothetical protein
MSGSVQIKIIFFKNKTRGNNRVLSGITGLLIGFEEMVQNSLFYIISLDKKIL